jgi:hypothetical protein
MSLVGSDNLDQESLQDDGFGYSESLDKGWRIRESKRREMKNFPKNF